MIATFVRDIDNKPATQKLWKLDSLYAVTRWWDDDKDETTRLIEYVITSAVNAFDHGEETYLFPANEDGEIISWIELPGSFHGDMDHDRAIEQFCNAVKGGES